MPAADTACRPQRARSAARKINAIIDRLKILASIEAEKLDIILADREAMDAFAAQGYLMPLKSVFADDPQILDRPETGYGSGICAAAVCGVSNLAASRQ